jgi:hypothetical protein
MRIGENCAAVSSSGRASGQIRHVGLYAAVVRPDVESVMAGSERRLAGLVNDMRESIKIQ